MTVPAWFSLTVGITGFTVLAVVVILWWEDQPARVRGRQLIADTEAWLHGGPALASETEAWLRDRTGADWR